MSEMFKHVSASKLLVAVVVLAIFVFPFRSAAQTSGSSGPLLFILLDDPCRMYDSRSPVDTIAANEVKIVPTDPLNSPLQGGETGCGVSSSDAAAVRINVKGKSTTSPAGYFRIFNADASIDGNHSSLQLQGPDHFIAIELDVPITGTSSIAIHSSVEAHAVVDLVGYYVEQ
jgi:hypothetical protein